MWLLFKSLPNGRYGVVLTSEFPNSGQETQHCSQISPLYPVEPEAFLVPKTNSFYLAFVVHPAAFAAVGALDMEDRKRLLFGIGLPSIVVCSEERQPVTDLISRWEPDLRAYEIWHVVNGELIEAVPPVIAKPINGPKALIPLGDSVDDADAKWILLELELNLLRFGELSAQFAPSDQDRYSQWVRSIRGIAEELCFLEKVARGEACPSPPHMSKRDVAKLKGDSFYRRLRTNASIDKLVHVNSSLVYAISQSFSGGVPIRTSQPMISQHSLLGIGSAVLALKKVCSFIEDIFEDHPVPKVISEQFPKLPWRSAEVNCDTPAFDYAKDALDSNVRDAVRPKITFFSARLGFGESDFTITCATQSLHAASSPRYPLMTISHEMLHAHVKALLIAIFSAVDSDGELLPFEESLGLCINEYNRFRRDGVTNDLRFIHTIRFITLEFIVDFRKYSALAKAMRANGGGANFKTSAFEVTVPKNTESWQRAFRDAYRFLEEVVVHTFDLHYFYSGQVQPYVSALWASWESVPSTADKLEWYILRTLVAVATTVQGDVGERFDKAKRIVQDHLLDLKSRHPGGVLDAVIGHLDQELLGKWLFYLFVPSIKLADMTTKYLMDRRIIQRLQTNDGWAEWNGERNEHRLPTLAFDEKRIQNPILFVQDRLMRCLLVDKVRETEEEAKLSAWMFLALADNSESKDEDQPVVEAKPPS